MSEQSESPVFEFLMKKQNLEAVLEVLRYGIQIRKKIASGFWTSLEKSFKERQPPYLVVDLSWKRLYGAKERDLLQVYAGLKDDYGFSLDASPGHLSEEAQGISYRIETNHKYFGFGLFFRKEVQDLESLLRKFPMLALRARISKFVSLGPDVEPDPNRSWFWWLYWERNIYESEPWFWFTQERDSVWFESKAKSFWRFVELTYDAVVEANKALERT